MGESFNATLPTAADLRERIATLYEEIDLANALLKAREKLERRAEIGRAARPTGVLESPPPGPPPGEELRRGHAAPSGPRHPARW